MPFVDVSWLAGRDPELKQELAARIVAAVSDVGGVPPESVWVVFRDLPREDWVVGTPGTDRPTRTEESP